MIYPAVGLAVAVAVAMLACRKAPASPVAEVAGGREVVVGAVTIRDIQR